MKAITSTALSLCMTAAVVAGFGVAQAALPASPGAGYAAKTERGQLAQQIVRKWSGYVNQIYGTTPMQWSNDMAGTFSAADISNLRAASKRQTYEAMMGTLLGQQVTDDKVITALARSNGSLASVDSIGSPAAGLVYTMITPCRIVDTRLAGGALVGNLPRSFKSNALNFSFQGGSVTNCGIPDNTSAVVMNVTVVNSLSSGEMKLYPFGESPPLAASVNFAANQIVSNELIVKQTLGQSLDFSVLSASITHVVIDVAGYFMAPEATALDCLVSESERRLIPAASTASGTATCPTGYRITGVSCDANPFTVRITSTRVNHANNSGDCWVFNTRDIGTADYVVQSTCCRVPGR